MVSGYRVSQVQQYSGISNAVKGGQLSGLKETVTINMFQSDLKNFKNVLWLNIEKV